MKRLFLLLVVLAIITSTVTAYSATYYLTADADDGYTQRNSVNITWADVRDGAGTDVDTTSVQLLTDIKADTGTNKYAYLHRSHLIFNTSDLPDSDIWIDSATIRLTTVSTSVLLGDMGVGFTKFTIDGTITGDDYDNCGSALETDYKNISTLGGTTNTWTLNFAGRANISKTGLTGFCKRLEPDISNTAVWVSDKRTYFGAYSAAHVTESEIPLLTVSYTLKPTAGFTGAPTSGTNPLSVTFTDTSTNSPTNWDWYWSADETKDSDLQHPTEIFTTAGTYNVRLYTSNAAGGDWENKTAYITVIPAASDIYISSVSSVTNNGATFGIGNGQGGNVWVGYGQNPQGQTWKSKNVSAPLGTASVVISGGNILTGTTYYAHACQASGCNTSYESFTTLAAGTITQTNYGAGFDNLTESNFDMFFLLPALMGTYTTVIPLNIFFGLLLGVIVLGMWASNKSTRLVSILFIIAAPLLFTADSGLSIGIPGVMQSLGEACLAVGIAGILLSLIRR